MTEVDLRAATRSFAPPPPGRADAPDADFLTGEEAARARSFGVIITLLCLLVLACVPFLGRAWPMDVAVVGALVGLAAVSAGCAAYAWWARRYPPALFRLHGLTAVLAAAVIQYYLGVFSPTALAVALGLAFFGQGRDGVTAWAIGLGAAGSYAALAVLLTAGVVADRGVFAADGASLAGKAFMAVVVPIVMLLTVAQARANGRATRELVVQVADATRRAEGDEARLREVARELDAVRLAGARQPGRWTGRSIGTVHLGGVIGRGASGEVYEGTDAAEGLEVAVKLLRPGLADDPAVLARFEREGRIAAGLRSPHVVRVFASGRAEEGTPFIVMERVSGDDLAAILRESPRLPEGEVLHMMADVAHALAEAHGWGIVHRDVKPSNLMLAREPARTRWRLVDFGVAVMTGAEATSPPWDRSSARRTTCLRSRRAGRRSTSARTSTPSARSPTAR
jgi:serine/threonine-protein kinase